MQPQVNINNILQHKLKSGQKEKIRQFINFTQTTENISINCLSAHDWRLEAAVDNFFQFPERYCRDVKQTLDRKKIETLFNRYRG